MNGLCPLDQDAKSTCNRPVAIPLTDADTKKPLKIKSSSVPVSETIEESVDLADDITGLGCAVAGLALVILGCVMFN